MLAMATYMVTMKFAVDLRNPYLRSLLAALHQDDLKRSEAEMKDNLNALAVKVGELQARILRLDAFGERLGKAAGVKPEEFRFDEKPGQGGPAAARGGATSRWASSSRCSTRSRACSTTAATSWACSIRCSWTTAWRAKTIPTTMPVTMGYYSSNYGYRLDPINGRNAFHTGVDLIAPPGTPVVAAAGGVVSDVAFVPEYGNIVEVDHDNGLTTRYAHLSKSLVKVGDVVMKGQNIALVGATGRVTGPHLHFEVREKGIPLEPEQVPLAGDQERRGDQCRDDRSSVRRQAQDERGLRPAGPPPSPGIILDSPAHPGPVFAFPNPHPRALYRSQGHLRQPQRPPPQGVPQDRSSPSTRSSRTSRSSPTSNCRRRRPSCARR